MKSYVFISLFAIAAYTVAMTYEPEQQGYTQSQRKGMDRLIGQINMATKPVDLWRTAKAAALADVYGISPDEVNKPIAIWGVE